MTTITIRAGVVCADGLATRGGSIVAENTEKLFRLPCGGVAAVCGTLSIAMTFIDWLKSDKTEKKPSLGDDENASSVIVLDASGVTVYEIGGSHTVNEEFCAFGSGLEAARAAMIAGKSAIEALHIAARCDVWTGGIIMSMGIEPCMEI